MYTPQFPYIGNQAIITSDRVTLVANKDAVFIFGDQAVGLSSKHTVNIDAVEKVIISSPKIELGNKSSDSVHGEPLVLGTQLVNQLTNLLSELILFMDAAKKISYKNLNTLNSSIQVPADKLSKSLPPIRDAIKNSILSQKVFLQKN
jgi:hypothetical protein